MSYDLALGSLRRDWSIGLDEAIDRAASTREQELERYLRSGVPERRSESTVESRVREKVREAAPEAMRLYDKYRPTYGDHQVVLRMKMGGR